MGNLRYTVDEDGKRVWRLEENDGGDERHLEAPCESMRRAQDQALRAMRDIKLKPPREAEPEKKENTGGLPEGDI